MSDAYFLPPHTGALIDAGMPTCKNLGLILDKYIPQDVINESKNKGPWLKYLIQEQSQTFDAELLEAVNKRRASMLRKFQTLPPFTASLAWRMVIGLGGESVLETDLTLHHLYGIPFIPASALKGLTRAYAATEEQEYFVPADKPNGERAPSPEIDKDHEVLQRIFGSQKHAGTVLFFDALPTSNKLSFVVDIMNPHYPDYYNSLKNNPKAPTNDQSPNPITFLAVADTSFTFIVAPRDATVEQHRDDVRLAQQWLKLALQKYGVGGKTSAGYGYFDVPEEQQPEAAREGTSQRINQPEQKAYERPKIPNFRAGQEIKGSVVLPTDELRKIAPEALAFLCYEAFALKEVLLIVNADEARVWKPGDTRICVFTQEEVRENCTVLVCQPREKKKAKK